MIFSCPNCKKTIQNGEASGQLMDCPHCGSTIEVPYSNAAKYAPRKHAPAPTAKADSGLAMYFWLGLLFSFLGLLIAAIVGKDGGLRAAFRGFIVGFIVQIVCGVILALL